MKVKTRIILVVAAATFLLVTFQILGWELQRYEEEERQNLMSRLLERKRHGTVTPIIKLLFGSNNEQSQKKEEKIAKLVKKYRVDLKFPLVKSPWTVAADWVNLHEIHPSYAPELGNIIHALATRNITFADFGHRGTQLKLTLKLEGGQRVAFKPMWYARDHVIRGVIYKGHDRHNGEIAAFHLNRLLEFRRAPIVTGRRINLKDEIMPVATDRLLQTFFLQDGNTCFYGNCRYCRNKEDGACADDTLMEGAIILWLPSHWSLQPARSPWSRYYDERKKALWETDDTYCDIVMTKEPYSHGRVLLDLVDTSLLDYLISNGDRHHYEKFKNQPDAAVLLLDSAKSFGNPYEDERSILAPLYQCCRLRKSTFTQLLVYSEDSILSTVLQRVMGTESIAPVLTDAHFAAINRRFSLLLKEIERCFQKHGKENVLVEE